MATQREFTAEEVQKKLQGLSPEVKSLIYGDDMTKGIQKVGEKNKLHYDQMGTLELETKNVMLGFTETTDFSDILMQSLSISKEQADAIVTDVNSELFTKIRDAMKKTSISAEVPKKISNPPAMNTAPTPTPGAEEKSVVMPSAVKASAPEAPAAMPTPAAPPVAPPAPEAPKPASFPQMPHIDALLSEPTVSIAPKIEAAPVAPAIAPSSEAKPASTDVTKSDVPKPPPIYKTDPYHEPVD